MKRKISIEYHIWPDGGDMVKEDHIDALEESAEELLCRMLKEGWHSGIFNDNICLPGEPDEGTEYTGKWKIERSHA